MGINDGNGCFWPLAVALLIVMVIVVGSVASLKLAADVSEAQVDKAEQEVRLELARAERDRVQSQAWQEKFMLWTVALDSFSSDGQVTMILLAGALGATVAIGLTRWMSRLNIF